MLRLVLAGVLLTLPCAAQVSPGPPAASQAPATGAASQNQPAASAVRPAPAGQQPRAQGKALEQQQPARGEASAQSLQSPPQMPPGEAYAYAMAPYNDARQQPDDLTDADRWALGISISRAREQCARLSPYKEQTEELLALGKLCVLGQDYDDARSALIAYLGLTAPKAKEEGRLLLARAFLGLDQITPAESQMQSLMAEYPYDASIHWGIDQVIDAAEGRDEGYDEVVRRLQGQQLPFILETLRGPGALTKNGQISSIMLFRDGLRIAGQLRADGKRKDADALIGELSVVAGDQKFVGSASYPAIQAAFDRYALTGKPAPVAVLHAKLLTRSGALAPRNLSLKGSQKILVAFTLWAPSAAEMLGKTAAAVEKRNARKRGPEQASTAPAAAIPIYALTSFAANTGGEDKPSAEVLASLRALREGLANGVTLLVVPDDELKRFAFDSYPGGVAVAAHGELRYLDLLTPGAVRVMVRALGSGEAQ